jgi:HK97 family phage portal protein
MEGTGGDTTAVIGGGADIKPIGMTAADAQFVEMAHLTVQDASRIMGVPANLLGVQLEKAVPNLEQDLASWLRFGLGPELERIESIVGADDELFPAGAHTYPKFDTDLFVRGDVKTEATVLVALVQAGILTPNEARRVRGLDDLPGTVGDIPQITPVGGAPNPLSLSPAPPAPAESS